MLELRPTCEHCNKPLPPDSSEARVCSFECTFCQDCVEGVLQEICPNCGGGFERRPVRPRQDRRNGNDLERFPASQRVVHKPVDEEAHARRVAELEDSELEDVAARER